jgi:hypothetical protein
MRTPRSSLVASNVPRVVTRGPRRATTNPTNIYAVSVRVALGTQRPVPVAHVAVVVGRAPRALAEEALEVRDAVGPPVEPAEHLRRAQAPVRPTPVRPVGLVSAIFLLLRSLVIPNAS